MPVNTALASHYRQLLGLNTPWRITDITMSIEKQRLDLTIEWPSGKKVRCPECGSLCGVKDHREERVWRHLDTMQFQTYLHCRVPRSECSQHGAKTIVVPWAEANSRWTLMFEAFALLVLTQVPSLTKAASLLHMSWDETHALRARAVARGLRRRTMDSMDYLGMDEKSFGRNERFITVLCDLTGERVIEVAPSKSTEAACTVLRAIPEASRRGIQAVAMDMTASYERACATVIPDAEIVYDKFHIEQMLTTAVDKVRRSEHKALLAKGINVLSKTRYLWLRRPERWNTRQQEQFHNVRREFGEGKFSFTRIGRAWSIKEAFRSFWNYVYPGAAVKYFRRWYFWATHCRLDPVIAAAHSLDTHLYGLLAYFRHGITNAFSEGINSKIQDIKSAARGFRNFNNYRIAILFSCGKLDMQPQ